eukprot:gene31572-38157_t
MDNDEDKDRMREEDSLKIPLVRVSKEDSVVGPYRSATKAPRRDCTSQRRAGEGLR